MISSNLHRDTLMWHGWNFGVYANSHPWHVIEYTSQSIPDWMSSKEHLSLWWRLNLKNGDKSKFSMSMPFPCTARIPKIGQFFFISLQIVVAYFSSSGHTFWYSFMVPKSSVILSTIGPYHCFYIWSLECTWLQCYGMSHWMKPVKQMMFNFKLVHLCQPFFTWSGFT